MRAKLQFLVVGLAVTGLLVVVGSCTRPGGGGGGQITADFELDENLGEFEVQAGEPSENRGTGTFDLQGATVAAGTVSLTPEVVTVTAEEAGAGKMNVALQAGEPLVVTVRIADIDELETVCDDGEQYGPFEVTLDENNVPVSITPSEVDLSENTVDLINSGEISLCLRVVSPVSGTVTITRLTFILN
jgi:hypothetical protein